MKNLLDVYIGTAAEKHSDITLKKHLKKLKIATRIVILHIKYNDSEYETIRIKRKKHN